MRERSPRLERATAAAALGRLEEARAALWEGIDALASRRLLLVDRLDLVRALARLAGRLPADEGAHVLGLLGGQLRRISDSYNANSHFCLSLIDLVDGLVLGWVGDPVATRNGERREWEPGTVHTPGPGAREVLGSALRARGEGPWLVGALSWIDHDDAINDGGSGLEKLLDARLPADERADALLDWLAPEDPDSPLTREELLDGRDRDYARSFLEGAAAARELSREVRAKGLVSLPRSPARPSTPSGIGPRPRRGWVRSRG